MRDRWFVIWFIALCFYAPSYANAVVNLGTAGSFAVLAGSTVTNTGPSFVSGNLGVWPGTAITGFPPGIVNGGTVYDGNAVAMLAESDLTTAYHEAAGQPCSAMNTLTGEDLGGLTLMPGVYCFASSAQLTGTLTLDGNGNPNATFIFQVGSTLTTATGSSVKLVDYAQGSNLFWQIGSSATLGTTTDFAGNILALESITLNTGANIECGSALARNGGVTMDTNTLSACAGSSSGSIPEPGTNVLFGSGLLILGGLIACRRRLR
jgi:Ice-binding-like